MDGGHCRKDLDKIGMLAWMSRGPLERDMLGATRGEGCMVVGAVDDVVSLLCVAPELATTWPCELEVCMAVAAAAAFAAAAEIAAAGSLKGAVRCG